MAAAATATLEAPAETVAAGGRRVANVDLLRGIAAMAVLLVHAYALGGRAAPVRAQHFYDVPLMVLSTGPWLFFGISGYVISRPFVDRLVRGEPLPDTIAYALRRALRIFPLYWIIISFAIALDGTAGAKGWELPFHYLLLQNLIPGREEALYSVAWTLTLEALFYVLVPILAAAVRGRRRTAAGDEDDGARPVSPERLATILVLSWLCSIAVTALADLHTDNQTGVWLRFFFPGMWQMFCPGVLLAIAPHLRAPGWRRWVVEFPRSPAALGLALAAAAAGFALYTYAPLRYGVIDYQLLFDVSRPLLAIAYGLLIAAAIRAAPLEGRGGWALELGLISYGIYLIHPVLADALNRAGLVPVQHDTLGAFLIHAVYLAALTVPLAMLSWRAIEQPAIVLARRLGATWRRA